jgi:hypothetical protein
MTAMPNALIDETQFVPKDLAQADELEAALIKAGTSRAKAWGVVRWLQGGRKPIPPATKTGYRRELVRLGSPPWEPNEGMGAYISRIDGRRRQNGYHPSRSAHPAARRLAA